MLRRQLAILSLGALSIVAVGCCFVFSGWLFGEISAVIPQDDPSYKIGQSLEVTGFVTEEVRQTKSGYRAVFQCESPISGKVMLYMPSTAQDIKTNDRLDVQMDVQPLSQTFPAYANYLHHQGIHASAKARSITVKGRHTGILMNSEMSPTKPAPTAAAEATSAASFLMSR